MLAAAEASPAEEQPDPSFLMALAKLGTLRLPIIVLAHQPSLGPGLAPADVVEAILGRLHEVAGSATDFELEVCFCGHPAEGSECLGAGPNLLQCVAAELRLDLARSVFLSDRSADLSAASALGARAVLLGPEHSTLPVLTSGGVPRAATLSDAVQLLRDETALAARRMTAAALGAVPRLDSQPAFISKGHPYGACIELHTTPPSTPDHRFPPHRSRPGAGGTIIVGHGSGVYPIVDAYFQRSWSCWRWCWLCSW